MLYICNVIRKQIDVLLLCFRAERHDAVVHVRWKLSVPPLVGSHFFSVFMFLRMQVFRFVIVFRLCKWPCIKKIENNFMCTKLLVREDKINI